MYYEYAEYSDHILHYYRTEADWERNDLNTHSFHKDYVSDDKIRMLIMLIYFAFTTLSTVGFGDIHPKSDPERLFNIVIFVSGVSIFSYFMGNLIEILHNIMSLHSVPEKDEELSMFFTALERFNKATPLNEDFKKRIIAFFEYSWVHDKKNSFKSEEDLYIFDQMPEEQQVKLITNYLYKDFILKFYKFFRVQKPNMIYYTWADQTYREFMVDILNNLEPRSF